MARSEVLSRFGPPDHKQDLAKTSDTIFGPVESFWARVPMGAQLEIWSYRSTQAIGGSSEVVNGSTELYFINRSETVDGIGFAAQGVVY